MQKRLVMLLVIAMLMTTGIVYGATLMTSLTYSMNTVTAKSYQWTPITYIHLESLTSGIAATSIKVSWLSGNGLVEGVRLYKDTECAEKSVEPYGTYAVFTEPEVMGSSCGHTWGVQFQVSYSPNNYVWVEPKITFYGLEVTEIGNPPSQD